MAGWYAPPLQQYLHTDSRECEWAASRRKMLQTWTDGPGRGGCCGGRPWCFSARSQPPNAAQVEPINSILDMVPGDVPKILFNDEDVDIFRQQNPETLMYCSSALREDIMASPMLTLTKDLYQSIGKLVDDLGWKDDFEALKRDGYGSATLEKLSQTRGRSSARSGCAPPRKKPPSTPPPPASPRKGPSLKAVGTTTEQDPKADLLVMADHVSGRGIRLAKITARNRSGRLSVEWYEDGPEDDAELTFALSGELERVGPRCGALLRSAEWVSVDAEKGTVKLRNDAAFKRRLQQKVVEADV